MFEVNDGKESTNIDVDCQAVAEDYEDFVLEEDHNWDIFETPIEVPHDAAVDIREFENQSCSYKKELDMKKNTTEEENSISKYTKDTPEVSETRLDKKLESMKFSVSEDKFQELGNSSKSFNSRQVLETAPIQKKCVGPISNLVHMMISVDSLYNTK